MDTTVAPAANPMQSNGPTPIMTPNTRRKLKQLAD